MVPRGGRLSLRSVDSSSAPEIPGPAAIREEQAVASNKKPTTDQEALAAADPSQQPGAGASVLDPPRERTEPVPTPPSLEEHLAVQSLAGEPKEEVYEEAQRLDVSGRSSMSKEELVQAVVEAQQTP